MWLFFCFIWLTLTAPAWAQSQPPAARNLLTLEEAVSTALRDNRQVKNAALEVSKSEHMLAAVRTRRWPSFDVIVGENWLLNPPENFNALGGAPGVLPIPIPITSATNLVSNRQPTALMTGLMAQPLSQQYRIGLNISMHDVMRDIAREQLRAKRQSVASEVKRLYYGILQTQSSLESVEETIRFLRELNRLSSRYLKEKTVLKSELLEAQARLAQEEQQQIVLHNQLATQKQQLNDLMGRNILTEFRVNPVPEATAQENDLDGARARALQQRPEVQESRLKVRQAEYDRWIKQSEYIPDISFIASYARTVNLSPVPENLGFAGFLMTWEPFDWGRKRHELASKTQTVAQTKNMSRETESQVLIDVDSKFRNLQASRGQLKASRAVQQAAREKLKETMDAFKNEAALIKDVLQAQTHLAQADSEYQKSLSGFWTAKAEFEKATGEEK
ncbi:MAG: TolC family protein [Deltaproteobacteria bacterium]|nr:TolC family protein [Deltaproteobacteria bacterium]